MDHVKIAFVINGDCFGSIPTRDGSNGIAFGFIIIVVVVVAAAAVVVILVKKKWLCSTVVCNCINLFCQIAWRDCHCGDYNMHDLDFVGWLDWEFFPK